MISQQFRAATKAAPPPAAKPHSVTERMADVMREMRAAGQIVTADSLAVAGDFTNAEVSKFAREASDMARARETRQVA